MEDNRGIMTIQELMNESFDTAKEKGWIGDGKTVGDHIALMHSELSEALEVYRNGRPVKKIFYEDPQWDGKPEGLPIELADVVIRIAQFCKEYDIDLERALGEKLEFNKTRPYRHGGKVI